jgi:hypothetical protein
MSSITVVITTSPVEGDIRVILRTSKNPNIAQILASTPIDVEPVKETMRKVDDSVCTVMATLHTVLPDWAIIKGPLYQSGKKIVTREDFLEHLSPEVLTEVPVDLSDPEVGKTED